MANKPIKQKKVKQKSGPKAGATKGRAKTGGRLKGTKNKLTLRVAEAFAHNNFDLIKETLKAIELIDVPADKANALLTMWKYVYPVLKATEIKTDEVKKDNNVNITFSTVNIEE